MNYPLWDIPYLGGGLVIAIIAILHVFISHFAVGAGLYNVWTERRARLAGDTRLLGFVRRHSLVLILLSMVLGALTGVGIWFAIGLVQPDGTSTLIHVFVWAWAVEWLFFVVEVVAALTYYYGWDRLSPALHERVGWIYAGAAWLSLFVINGILTFMLTPGDWLETRNVWDAFFNPSFWPSLVLRTLVALALAGLYTLLMASLLPTDPHRSSLIRYSARWVAYPLVAMAPAAVWYVTTLPEAAARWFAGASAPLTMFTLLSTLFTALVLAVILVVAVRQPQHFTWPTALLVLFFGLLATASTEMVREAIRRPFIIWNYMYANSVRLENVPALMRDGVLPSARWAPVREAPPASRAHSRPEMTLEAGRAIFDLQCRICHTPHGFNAVTPLIAGWRERTLYDFLGAMHEMKPFMPPFLGTGAERRALAAWLATLADRRGDEAAPRTGPSPVAP